MDRPIFPLISLIASWYLTMTYDENGSFVYEIPKLTLQTTDLLIVFCLFAMSMALLCVIVYYARNSLMAVLEPLGYGVIFVITTTAIEWSSSLLAVVALFLYAVGLLTSCAFHEPREAKLRKVIEHAIPLTIACYALSLAVAIHSYLLATMCLYMFVLFVISITYVHRDEYSSVIRICMLSYLFSILSFVTHIMDNDINDIFIPALSVCGPYLLVCMMAWLTQCTPAEGVADRSWPYAIVMTTLLIVIGRYTEVFAFVYAGYFSVAILTTIVYHKVVNDMGTTILLALSFALYTLFCIRADDNLVHRALFE
ncbi:MAG: hypothetical protein CMK92_03330 [Pseudomonas sp.]|nr:hypothetical protein [Pseudomonas sp.]